MPAISAVAMTCSFTRAGKSLSTTTRSHCNRVGTVFTQAAVSSHCGLRAMHLFKLTQHMQHLPRREGPSQTIRSLLRWTAQSKEGTSPTRLTRRTSSWGRQTYRQRAVREPSPLTPLVITFFPLESFAREARQTCVCVHLY